ncbi:MAG: hypothetical protein LAP21_28345 [Acidobacteriia bacterium]|nr:hypothetical protein [Terriglobia bacterium]
MERLEFIIHGVLWFAVGLIVGLVGGRIWQRYADIGELHNSELIDPDEIALINAHRLRKAREAPGIEPPDRRP